MFRKIRHSRHTAPASVIIMAVACIGLYTLTTSHAATPYAASEAEAGALTGNATIISDTNASSGQAIQFGSPLGTGGGSTCTSPSHTIAMDPSNAQTGISLGNFYVTNDTWNTSSYQVSQTLFVCSASSWYATATMNNNNGDGAVKSYPNVHEDFNSSPKISSFSTISSSFAETAPHVGIYEYAYDMWLNGVADDNSTEVMIWNDNFNQTPGGSKQGTFTDGGQTYNVYRSGSYIAFVDTANVTSGTVNILDFYNYIIGKSWIASTSTVGQIDYGVELVSTNNQSATFNVNNFTLTAQ
jgi:hypothetical protein